MKGPLIVKLEKFFSENIPQMESVFLEIEGRPVPFFISGSEYSGADILKLRLKDMISVEKVIEFTGCRVFLTTEMPVDDKSDNFQSLTGYKVIVNGNNQIGSIAEVIPNSGQWLLSIISLKNKEILIPFHEHFIVSIDKREKIIVMDIPEGLTDIN